MKGLTRDFFLNKLKNDFLSATHMKWKAGVTLDFPVDEERTNEECLYINLSINGMNDRCVKISLMINIEHHKFFQSSEDTWLGWSVNNETSRKLLAFIIIKALNGHQSHS